MAVQSSDPNSTSAIQPDTLNISTQVPLLLESGENRSPGSDDSHDTEHQTKMVSATVPAPTRDKETTPVSEVNRSEQQTNEVLVVGIDTVGVLDTAIVDHEGGSDTDVDMHTYQSAEIEGDKDHGTESVLEAPCDASGKDSSSDLTATTVVTAESDKISSCDMEVVCAGNSESSSGGEGRTIGVQEAAAVADNEGVIGDFNGTSMHDQALASGGGKSLTVQEAAAIEDPGSMHDHEVDDGAPGNVLQGTESHGSEQTKVAPAVHAAS